MKTMFQILQLQNLLGQYEQSFHAERSEKEVLTREYEHLRQVRIKS